MTDDDPSLRVRVGDARGRPVRAPGLGRWLARAAPRAVGRAEVSVALVSDAFMRRLNRRFAGKSRATDVLSFPADGWVASSTTGRHGRLLGDIVIATGVARRQAARAGHAYATELRILALHGLLHLLGYDHERDAGQMARLERRLRVRAGLPTGVVERGLGR